MTYSNAIANIVCVTEIEQYDGWQTWYVTYKSGNKKVFYGTQPETVRLFIENRAEVTDSDTLTKKGKTTTWRIYIARDCPSTTAMLELIEVSKLVKL